MELSHENVIDFSTFTVAKNLEHFAPISKPTVVSVIAPFYNESEVLPVFHERLLAVLDNLSEACEIIYVDDGSTDNSLALARSFSASKTTITCVALSRNFGKESALSAGLAYSKGQAVIVIDTDLQDPPELIPQMLEAWREGSDIVNMQRKERHGESWFKRTSAACFYRLMNSVTKFNVPENVGDFRLLDRKIVTHLNNLPEKNRYMKGLFSWPGFTQRTLSFNRDARFSGVTKWNYFKLFGLAVDGITSFSLLPLRIASVLGSLLLGGACMFTAFECVNIAVNNLSLSIFPLSLVAQVVLGGIQLMSIGILGEYVGRIHIESKHRPLYLVQSVSEKVAISNNNYVNLVN